MTDSTLNPRKLPRQARAQVTRDAIIEAAAHILSKDGLEGYNTNAVAERAGVSIGSLYQYFPNKDALMVALIDRQQAQQLARVEAAALAPPMPLADLVRLIVRAAMGHHTEDSLLATAIDHEEARLPVAAIITDYQHRGGEAVRALFARHADEIKAVNLDRAVQTLPALLRAVVDCWANRSPPQLADAEEEAVRAVMGYLSWG